MSACSTTKVKFKIRRGTTDQWIAGGGVILAEGEPGYDTVLNKLKIGAKGEDGNLLPWGSLPVVNIGPSGASGPSGPSGPSGASGPSGVSDVSGPSGPSGVSGPSGPSGPSGVSGPSGPSGPSGVSDVSGPSGASGPSGPSGPVTVLNALSSAGAAQYIPLVATTPLLRFFTNITVPAAGSRVIPYDPNAIANPVYGLSSLTPVFMYTSPGSGFCFTQSQTSQGSASNLEIAAFTLPEYTSKKNKNIRLYGAGYPVNYTGAGAGLNVGRPCVFRTTITDIGTGGTLYPGNVYYIIGSPSYSADSVDGLVAPVNTFQVSATLGGDPV